ncbi:MAG: ATP-binding protein [Planctomycetota bacterium]
MASDQSPDNAGTPADSGAVEIRQERGEIDAVEAAILSAAERKGFPSASLFAVRLAVEEAISNAFRHGHKGLDPSLSVKVEFRVSDQAAEISVEDQGPGFEPQEVPDPTLDENLELPSGRGLMLIRSYMSDVRHSNGGRRLEMRYDKPSNA